MITKLVCFKICRNAAPILDILTAHLPTFSQDRQGEDGTTRCDTSTSGMVLEVASGTGQHVAGWSKAFPEMTWQPSDREASMFSSIRAWCAGQKNVRDPIIIDCSSEWKTWNVARGSCSAVVCINMTHISPWDATCGLLSGAAAVLCPEGGRVFLYGPFKVNGKATTASNEDFDVSLKSRNAAWGLRDVADVDAQAALHGMTRTHMIPMPANNFTLIYQI